jgi:hypothetical protein
VESSHNFTGKILVVYTRYPKVSNQKQLFEEKSMKSTIKIVLLMVLCTSVMFAEEGDMGNGPRTCPSNKTTCVVATDPLDPTDTKETTDQTDDSKLTSVEEFFEWLFEYFENQE